ncbi:hypothetical protein ACIBM4_05920 [Streptomyces sp. NPDC050256]|uniref:hypothetical protein n=1 Tax=unclassified Streptomyces TaxID=2593676 RepID=UPI0037B27062
MTLLALRACAVLAGARSLLAVGEWVADASPACSNGSARSRPAVGASRSNSARCGTRTAVSDGRSGPRPAGTPSNDSARKSAPGGSTVGQPHSGRTRAADQSDRRGLDAALRPVLLIGPVSTFDTHQRLPGALAPQQVQTVSRDEEGHHGLPAGSQAPPGHVRAVEMGQFSSLAWRSGRQEPYDERSPRTDLWEPEGANPSGSPTFEVPGGMWWTMMSRPISAARAAISS